MFHDRSSIPNVCGQFAHHLSRRLAISVHSYMRGVISEERLRPLAGIDTEAPIGFFYGIPDSIGTPVKQHSTRIIGLACETDRVPDSWVQHCNDFDLVVVPSRYCLNSLKSSGVETPIMIAPHGLEPEYAPMRPKSRSSRFIFYNVVNSHMPERKSLLELLRAFKRAFADRPDVVLRIRSELSPSVVAILDAAEIADDDQQVQIIEQSDLPTADFAAYYSEVHCTVHPSRAEGFGLIPLQSIACETPIIAPCATGMADYLDESNAIVLRTLGTNDRPAVYYRTGSQPLIDEDHLVDRMRHVEANWQMEYEKVQGIGPDFRRRYTWPNALGDFVELVAGLAACPDPQLRRDMINQRCRALSQPAPRPPR